MRIKIKKMRLHLMATMLMLQLCATLLVPQTVQAQTVDTIDTPLENLKSGYYAMAMMTSFSDYSITDSINGNFVYFNESDKTTRFDKTVRRVAIQNLRGTKLSRSDYKYVFYIDKDANDMFTFRAWGPDDYY